MFSIIRSISISSLSCGSGVFSCSDAISPSSNESADIFQNLDFLFLLDFRHKTIPETAQNTKKKLLQNLMDFSGLDFLRAAEPALKARVCETRRAQTDRGETRRVGVDLREEISGFLRVSGAAKR